MKAFLLCFIMHIALIKASVLTIADFLYQPSYTNTQMWNNYFGAVMNID